METSDTNVFNIDNADKYQCTVWMYRVHHPILVIRVSFGTEKLCWLNFYGVGYYEGPLSWKGARFDILSKNEQRKLRRHLGHYGNHDSDQKHIQMIEHQIENYELYCVRPTMKWLSKESDLMIKILAERCEISTEDYKIGDFFA